MITTIVYDRRQDLSAVLVDMLTRVGGALSVHSAPDWSRLREMAAREPSTVVVLGPGTTTEDLGIAFEAGTENPSACFVLVADSPGAELLQKAMRHGVRDVVAVDRAEEDLLPAVLRAHALGAAAGTSSSQIRRRGKVVTIFGGTGGTGKTVLAANLAVRPAEQKVATALFDTNLSGGDCAIMLKLRPERTLADVKDVPGRLDSSILGGLLTRHRSRLNVLCAPGDPRKVEGLQPSHVERVIQGLREMSDLVVVDTGPSFDAYTLTALRAADISYLVTSLELPAIKSARIWLSAIEDMRIGGERIRLVLNRADSKVEFPVEEAERALKRKFSLKLPSDIAVPRAVNKGVPLHEESSRSKIAKALDGVTKELIADLLPKSEPRPTRALPFSRARSVAVES